MHGLGGEPPVDADDADDVHDADDADDDDEDDDRHADDDPVGGEGVCTSMPTTMTMLMTTMIVVMATTATTVMCGDDGYASMRSRCEWPAVRTSN